jgi:hypothetical protein
MTIIQTIATTMLRDAHRHHGVVFNNEDLSLTSKKLVKRFSHEGDAVLTTALPTLGRHFDKVLAGREQFNPSRFGFDQIPDTRLPKLMGSLFERVLSARGDLLHDPDANCVRTIRQILHAFGKYEATYKAAQEQTVIDNFTQVENELVSLRPFFASLRRIGYRINHYTCDDRLRLHDYKVFSFGLKPDSRELYKRSWSDERWYGVVIRRARKLLYELLSPLDFYDIIPRHGPGTVSTKEQYSDKFRWTNVSKRITEVYPFDAYFTASLGHLCDTYQQFSTVGQEDTYARVILVPKDSRGPRLISCEPVDKQWIQQGICEIMVKHVERHPLTKGFVNFTDQSINRSLALVSSLTSRGTWWLDQNPDKLRSLSDSKFLSQDLHRSWTHMNLATLDLKDASDRVSDQLVRLLFPEHVYTFLGCCRSTATELPNGELLRLEKFAPMGSALCFPVMALTIWSLLKAALPDPDIPVWVYGDDVIVPRDYSRAAMATLESFGLAINHDKSCDQGFFRESCGMDAFSGVDVTPIRFRTVWSPSPSPSSYVSWIAYSNAFHESSWHLTSRLITDRLSDLYGPVPSSDMNLSCPSLLNLTYSHSSFKSRWNPLLQKREYRVPCLKSVNLLSSSPDWIPFFRFVSESGRPSRVPLNIRNSPFLNGIDHFEARLYTTRNRFKMRYQWR